MDMLRKVAELAKIGLSSEEEIKICSDIERIASYLSAVSQAAKEVGGEPLYYVWDSYGHVREGGSATPLNIADLPAVVRDGLVAVPWRGGAIESERGARDSE